MKRIEFLLIQLEGILYIEYPTLYYNLFNNPSNEKYKFLDDSLSLLYKWRDGMDIAQIDNLGRYQFCGCGYFLPYQEAEVYKNQFLKEKYFDKNSYFPIVASLGGDFLLVDCNKKKSKVYLYSPGLIINSPMEIYASLESFIETIYECFRQKAYTYDKNFYLQIDHDLEKEITLKFNPHSKFWHQD